jgi:hypothetical protein
MWFVDYAFIAVQGLLVIATLGFIIFEIILSLNNTEGDTISFIIRGWAYSRNFFVTLAWGIITGHLFLGSKSPLITDNTISVVVAALLACIAALIGCKLKSVKINRLVQLILFVGGTIIGHFMWSMNDVLIP